VQKHAFSSTKMFYTYTGSKHKKNLVRNSCSKFFKSLSQYFMATEERYVAMQNKRIEKMDKCPRTKRRRIKEKHIPYPPLQEPSMF